MAGESAVGEQCAFWTARLADSDGQVVGPVGDRPSLLSSSSGTLSTTREIRAGEPVESLIMGLSTVLVMAAWPPAPSPLRR
jgi:hypothetical protein